jgi:hypothetical protein
MHLFSRAIGRTDDLRARFLRAIALQALQIKTATLALAYIMGKTIKEFGLTCRGLR